ncbi:hypothetical protein KFK09_003321 [Dendrobium nobile]|uniref:Uncharacterized protein n=1 Tax=Dendrobium nobile TaxID=94219 RepID=A0A8T3C2Q1_DENNO|nr:hypothetical protein KFK09_003321 [Dendrobium nobile]
MKISFLSHVRVKKSFVKIYSSFINQILSINKVLKSASSFSLNLMWSIKFYSALHVHLNDNTPLLHHEMKEIKFLSF